MQILDQKVMFSTQTKKKKKKWKKLYEVETQLWRCYFYFDFQ